MPSAQLITAATDDALGKPGAIAQYILLADAIVVPINRLRTSECNDNL